MRVLLAACLLAGLSAAPALAQWDDDVSHARGRGIEDEGYGRRDRDGPRFRADDDARDLDRRDRRAFGRDDPDEIMPRRRDRDRDDDRRRRDWDDRDRRDDRFRSGSRYDPYDRFPPYGPPIAPPASGGVFVVPPPIPGARR
ncbi:hypothetical protein [Methylobacterium indicum]|uniref:hypothetical protein n=1 Tax=Methylobacterium indicum TaxID=1775910 RepID=UPI0024351D81|nr:hypothetical protein [Methylobacterium indicum]